MYRKISAQLLQWKNNPYRKPLILQGARQVGKTFSILDFGKENYDTIAYFNFETEPDLIHAFDESIDPEFLIPELSAKAKKTIVKEKTLIVFDEVQLCERALTSLKYFCEKEPGYHIIAAGSLLGVAVNRSSFSFPVGKVDFLTMFPMDFEEFLYALGEIELVKKIRDCYEHNTPMPCLQHQLALDLYKQYLYVGGMPECVLHYKEQRDDIYLRQLQLAILQSYLNDMSKYNHTSEIQKTRLTYDNITVQLSKKNTRFQYKLLKPGARASSFENAIEWLNLSGITSRIYRLEQIKKPLENYRDIDSFKIYLSDVGLLCAKKTLLPSDIIYDNPELLEVSE